jgi:anaerobic selenocysteine-containing dehydrogenase
MFADTFMAALKSPMSFGSMQIDQPGKPISAALHGMWMAGQANMDQADGWLVIGTNPAISMQGPPNPAHVTKRAKKRGAKIYVIDPRRTEIATQADIYLQVPPGQDAVILAGLIHIIFAEGLQDQSFIDENVNGLATLRQAVANFTPSFVAQRIGVPAERLQALARGYAACKSGVVFAGTGPNMSPHGTLMEYLRLALMSICGHWRRAGNAIAAPSVLVHKPPPLAQAIDPSPGWNLGQKMRVRGLTNTACGMPTSALAEEILLEGEGQVRVLIVNGGNPMMAWPDQLRTQEAMKKLDLLVCIDPVMSDTAKYAHYVIAPRLHFEAMSTTALHELLWAWVPIAHQMEAYAACSPALVEPPAGHDVIYDWEFFFELAKAMNLQLHLKPVSYIFDPANAQQRAIALDMSSKIADEEMWELLLADSPIPFSEVRPHATGKVFDLGNPRVLPKMPNWTGKLDVGNADMMQDLQRAFAGDAQAKDTAFRFRMVGRRLKDRYNSSWREHPVSTRQWAHNPTFIHPDDAAALGLADGDVVEIRSRRGAILGVVEIERTLLPGVVAMTHAWGGNPEDDPDPLRRGANTGLLTDTTADFDPYSAMPRMSTIPVNISLIKTAQSTTRNPMSD